MNAAEWQSTSRKRRICFISRKTKTNRMHAWDIIQPYTNIYIRAWINRCGSYVHDERWQQFALNFNAIATKQNPKHSQNTLFPWTNRIELEISQFLQFCRKTLRCMRFEPNSNALQRNLYGTLFGMLEMLIWIQDTIEALTYIWFGLANCISKLLSNNLIFCWIVIYSLPNAIHRTSSIVIAYARHDQTLVSSINCQWFSMHF